MRTQRKKSYVDYEPTFLNSEHNWLFHRQTLHRLSICRRTFFCKIFLPLHTQKDISPEGQVFARLFYQAVIQNINNVDYLYKI